MGKGGGSEVLPSVHLLWAGLRERILEGPEHGFTRDLQTLQGRTSERKPPPEVGGVNTPLVIDEGRRCLANHPDREFVDYIVRGLEEGFRLGFRHRGSEHRSAKSNMHSGKRETRGD